MRWHTDKEGGQWTATVTPDGSVRLLRQTVKPPYREGGEPTVEYQTIEFDAREAAKLGNTMDMIAAEAISGEGT
ncbi:MAG: hypothetical protein IOB84_07920 [Brevundimonas sp.]|nr:hypothetical protein [Brevundimonas sp.]